MPKRTHPRKLKRSSNNPQMPPPPSPLPQKKNNFTFQATKTIPKLAAPAPQAAQMLPERHQNEPTPKTPSVRPRPPTCSQTAQKNAVTPKTQPSSTPGFPRRQGAVGRERESEACTILFGTALSREIIFLREICLRNTAVTG